MLVEAMEVEVVAATAEDTLEVAILEAVTLVGVT
jgi:hypothetical protein